MASSVKGKGKSKGVRGKGAASVRAAKGHVAIKSSRSAKGHELIVSRRGSSQHFDERKLYSSIYLACMSTRRTQEESEAIAKHVCLKILKGLPSDKVDAHDLFNRTISELKKINEEIAFMYEYHFDIQ